MKNITKQYQDLLEGKMSKANFMVNVRRDFPQWISPVNSFQDAVNILKSKRILNEEMVSGVNYDTDVAIELKQRVGDLHKIAPYVLELGDIVQSDSTGAIHVIDRESGAKKIFKTTDEFLKGIRYGATKAEGIRKVGNDVKEADAGSHSGPIGGETQAGARHIAKMWDSLSDQAREDIIQAAGTFHDFGDIEKLAGMDFDAMMAAMPPGQGSINKLYSAIKQAAEDESMVSQMASKQDHYDPAFPGRDIEVPADRAMEEAITLEPELEKVLGQLDKEQKKDLIFWLKDKLTGKKSEPTSKIDPHDPYGSGLPVGSSMFQVTEKEALKEAAEKPEGRYKEATGKVEYDKFAEMDRVHYGQLMKGTEYELLKMPEISDENLVKAKKKAYSNLAKNPKYYMHLLINNEKDVEKKDKDLRMQPVKGDNKVDKANAMKVIKKDEGSNTQESLGNKEKAKGKPEGVKELPEKGVIGTEKVLRESLIAQLKEEIMDEMVELGTPKKNFSKGQKVETPEGAVGTVLEESPDSTITLEMEDGSKKDYQANVLKKHEGKETVMEDEPDEPAKDSESYQRWLSNKKGQEAAAAKVSQATNTDGVTFQIGDVVTTPDNTEIKITGFTKGKDGRMKAIYSAGMYADVYDIDYLEKKEDKHAALKEKLVKGLKKEVAKVTDEKGDIVKLATSTGEAQQFVNSQPPAVKSKLKVRP